jgi:hydroxyethylthiazole kinase-like uncharacterized protein yjeF
LDPAAAEAVAQALLGVPSEGGFVLDAAAIGAVRQINLASGGRTGCGVITPHAGEMARLTGLSREAVEADPLEVARQVAADHQVVVVMKGAQTWVVSPQGKAWLNEAGPAGLATSGSGDVLAGAISGLLARGATPVQAAAWGVFLHAQAGRRLSLATGPLGFLAREILPWLTRGLSLPADD